MKKILAMLLAVLMVLSMVACAGNETTDEPNKESGSVNENNENNEQNTDGGNEGGEIPTVELVMWGSEEDQELLQQMVDSFVAYYADQATITVTLGAVSEGSAKDEVLNDIEAGPDVFAFAHDQISALVNAGALMAIPEDMAGEALKADVSARNDAGSVAAATVNGEMYAFPMTSDNGYFMYYDKSVFTEEDLGSWEAMLAAAAAAGRYVTMDLGNAWYSYGFFAGAGLTVTLNEDGVTNSCDWACDTGVAVCEAIMALAAHEGFLNQSDTQFTTGVADGTLCAGVNGTWNASAVKEAWGENYGACKLPTFTLADGTVVQTGSFSGYKLVGVNAYSDNLLWAMRLANWITNEENQALRFEVRGIGPSNINIAATEAVQADPALAALLAQSAFSTAQNVGGNFWSPVATLGGILGEGNPDGLDLMDLLTQAVEGIEAAA